MIRVNQMKRLLQLWKNRFEANADRRCDERDESEASLELELLIPVSQLYGFEYYPAVHRYHEK